MPATKLVQRLRHATGTRISVYTVRNRLRTARPRAWQPYKGIPLMQRHRVARLDWVRFFFQQDNARCHTALYIRNVLAANKFNTLEWLSRSPDLSPIEHMWDHLGRRLRERNDVNNVNDLERALHEEWAHTPLHVIRRLINSLRRHCFAVIQARSGHIRYWHFCEFWFWPLCEIRTEYP